MHVMMRVMMHDASDECQGVAFGTKMTYTNKINKVSRRSDSYSPGDASVRVSWIFEFFHNRPFLANPMLDAQKIGHMSFVIKHIRRLQNNGL